MRKLIFLLSIFAIVLSCSSDETSTPVTPPPAPIVKYTITLSAGEGGTVSTTGGEYEAGQTVNVTATPQGEYVFTSWSDGNTNATRTITVSSNSTLTANFEKKKYPLTVNLEGEGEVLEEIVNAGRTTEYDSGTTVKLTAQPEDEWLFTGWSGDIGDIDPTENPIQLSIIESKTVTANFEKKKYPLTVNIEGEGEVLEEIVNSGRTTDYDSGTTVKLTAVPSEGWEFAGWTGAIESTELEVQLLVIEAKTLSATFNQKSPIYLDENGITIKAYDWANVGDKGIIDGVEYTIVNESNLREMVANDEDVTKVVTTKIIYMNGMFYNNKSFNQNISSWDVSNVIDMASMFNGTLAFNKDIGNWDVSNVTNMRRLFTKSTFNVDISNWDVSNVINMNELFAFNNYFNHDIGNWDVSSVIDMEKLFYQNSKFNMPLNNWNVSNVTNMSYMFRSSIFNQDLNSWDVSNVIDFSSMFASNDEFNQDLNSWDVSSATDMGGMFFECDSFNGNISDWDVSNVLDLSSMFGHAYIFNQDLSTWDVSSAIKMNRMFRASKFNYDISNWDVSNVIDMGCMFCLTSFNQDLSSWKVSSVITCDNFFWLNGSWTLPKPNFTNCDPSPTY
ncbi:BspA family leucine-rich repeat surface protein [Flavobacteriaceae bacterium]|nr:BspA family leucine-rich repeat surface protein [Flavobacteriaceae bacterium]